MRGAYAMRSRKRAVILFTVLLAVLVATALLASSCGSSGTSDQGGSAQMSGNAEIDSFLQQLDQEMSSVPADSEFDEAQISNSQLGL